MADVEHRIRVVIEADGTAKLADGTRLSAEQVRALGDDLSRTSRETESFSSKATQAGRSAADLGRDIAQGDLRGAAVNMARLAATTGAAEAATSGLGIAVGAGVAALGLWLAISREVSQETERQANAMLLTGNYAGLVAGELNQMASETARGINGAVGGVRETMEGLVASGRVTRHSLEETARAVELVAQFSGRSRADVVKDFADMAGGVADWAAKHNESYHFITFEQYKYIESLEKAGSKQEAMRVTSEALSQHLGGDLTRNLGTLQRAWQGVRNWASQAWDAMLNIGREDTAQDRIAKLTAQLDALQNRKTSGRYTEDQRQELIATLQAQLETAQESARLERRAATTASQRAQDDADKIARDREKNKKGGAQDNTYERMNAQIERRLALAQAEEENGRRLGEADRYRVEMLTQIAEAEKKIGSAKAAALRAAVEETAEVIRGNEARTEELKSRQALEAAALKESLEKEREIQTILNGNAALELQISTVGKSKGEIAELKAQRIEHAISMREEELATLALFDASSPRLEQLRREIDALRQKRDLTRDLGVKEQQADDLRKQEAAYKKFANEFGRDVTHSLRRAFEASKDPAMALFDGLANALKTRVSKALADAVMNPFMRPLEQALGNMGGMFSSVFNPSTPGYGGDMGAGLRANEADFMSQIGLTPNAKGNVYHSPSLSVYRNGVYDTPRTFAAYAKGGIFAEAGPEAIMPLKRMGDGNLGVHASMGAPQININVVNNTGSQVSVRQRQGGNGFDMELILDSMEAGLADRVNAGSGKLARAMEGRYGLSTAVN